MLLSCTSVRALTDSWDELQVQSELLLSANLCYSFKDAKSFVSVGLWSEGHGFSCPVLEFTFP